MSLSASMWTSVTGLLVHGEKMNVVGNNIANVNTLGFKGSRMDFEDFVNQNVFAAAGPSQVGRGVSIGAIYGNFSQGSFENTTEPTDMAISGEGFFKVKPVGSDTEYYTRAGNFRFNPDGYLVDPHGYALQGWRIQTATPSVASDSSGGAAGAASATTSFKGAGAPTNIKLDSFTCDPKHTNNMSLELNLDARESGKSGGATMTNPAYVHERLLLDPARPEGAMIPNPVAVPPMVANPDPKYVPDPAAPAFDRLANIPANNPAGTTYDPTYADPSHANYDPTSQKAYQYMLDPGAAAPVPPTFVVPQTINATYNPALADPNDPLYDLSDPDAYPYTLDTTTVPTPAAPTVPTFLANLPATVIDPTWTAMVPNTYTGAVNPAYAPGINEGISATIGEDPFFALFQTWDATLTAQGKPAIGEQAYAYQHTMDIYDEGGTKHRVTIYFDKVEASEFNGAVGGQSYWEYIVTMDPAEDFRDFYNHPDPNNPNQADVIPPSDKMKGVLMAGTMNFDKSGEFQNMTAYVPTVGGNGVNGMDDLNTWVRAPISTNGYPMFAPNFSGRPNASTPWDNANPLPTAPADLSSNDINRSALNYMVELNLGLRNTSPEWNGAYIDRAGDIGNDLRPAPDGTGISTIYGMNSDYIERQPSRTKSFAQGSAAVNQTQDGYSFGYLSTVYVDRDGILYGKYSNGETLALFQVALFDFMSPHNLRREGGNLFTQTRESGDERSGPANSTGLGSVYGSNIEQSNVDLATEFVQMIATQRGFQANSKSISTVDTMLETVIGMKR